MKAIQIKDVTKQYKDVTALDRVSLSFEYGKIYGLLGRNGAGKTTLINIIANRIFSTEGEVTIDGMPAGENPDVHEKIFCMSEADLYEPGLKVKDIFKWTNRFYDSFSLKKAYEISEKFALDTEKRFRALSKGYQSICKLVIALSLDVPYVIFDEPVLGLDANHRELFYELLLKDYQEKERTIIIATHLIEETARLIEEVVLIDKGRVLLQDSAENLLQNGYCVSGPEEAVTRYCKGKNVLGCDELGGMKMAYILGKREILPKDCGLVLSGMNLQRLFVKLTEREGN